MLLFGIQIIPNNIKITAGARGVLRLFLVLYELSEVKLVGIALQRIAKNCVCFFVLAGDTASQWGKNSK